MNLRRAPRFHAWFGQLEGRDIMLGPRTDWARLGETIQGHGMVAIDLSTTPIARVAIDCRVEAVVAVRRSEGEVVVKVYRYDPDDVPKPINVDRYRVWERLPPHRDYLSIVNSASTEDNANMRGFLEDHVFLTKADVDPKEHHLSELPSAVKVAIARGIGGTA